MEITFEQFEAMDLDLSKKDTLTKEKEFFLKSVVKQIFKNDIYFKHGSVEKLLTKNNKLLCNCCNANIGSTMIIMSAVFMIDGAVYIQAVDEEDEIVAFYKCEF